MTMPLLARPLGLRAADLRDPAECARLDDYARAHPLGTPFHLSGWGRAVAAGCRQRAHCLVAERADGSLAGLLPLTEIRSFLFGRALVSSGFGVGGGILAENEAAATALAQAGWALAERLGCPTMELRGGAAPGQGWTLDDETYLGFVRPLAASDDAELAAIPRKHRAEVRKGLAGELEVASGGRDLLATHYPVYAESVRNLGTPVFPRALFGEVMQAFGADCDIVAVSHQGAVVAAVLNLYMNGTVYPYWGGGTQAARGLRANERLYFALMCHARQRGCTRFDFGRSKAGTGPAAYKKNWGFEPRPLAYYKRTADGMPARDVNPLSPRYQARIAAWKKMPRWAAMLVGPVIARGLG
ncbi:FemAB family XrtA/PEP-CTERM system-associated protein [Sphingomonas sp.]|uniref:FemAB family XrtA/PEP-CTERM system-associated protein n=1 Tax=Sphingomonas sp. TaxID=28214 RepID=UPI001DC511EF|nr:FemAB family XrtA/PEP-CTERM system-associated protein [Sphingomonas sp.]MBX9796336.1 FemAB family PEP-CTERM system-associated protein [Sphingomonas sp.]